MLGLAYPVIPIFMGITDRDGDVDRSIRLPRDLPSIDLHGQGFTIGFSLGWDGWPGGKPAFALDFCTTNVVPLNIGG